MEATVIIPTCNRYPVLLDNLKNIRKQTYATEIIVCDDTHIKDLKENRKILEDIKNLANQYFCSTLYDHEGHKVYGLGRARNQGVIHANCEILIFLDDRITPANEKMVETFVKKLKSLPPKSKYWIFGDKGAQKTSFVENCSATRRQYLITSGMFCEAINSYGFMTRELFARTKRQGFEFIYIPEALAQPLCTGSRRNNEERERQIKYSRSILERMKLV
jgi:glycosyltransferase involved in cell wall biosynthesis